MKHTPGSSAQSFATACLVAVSALLASTALHAQAPVQFNNSPQALKQYEASTMDGLRERCPSKKAGADVWTRDELQGMRNGYVVLNERLPEAGRYTVFVFDQDKRSFTLIDGQGLERNARLHLKLALPRDYGRCRIMRSPTGVERLEVVHIERNSMADTQAIGRLLADANEMAQQLALPSNPPVLCAEGAAPKPVALNDRIMVQGKVLVLPACHEPALALRERLDKLVRKVFER